MFATTRATKTHAHGCCRQRQRRVLGGSAHVRRSVIAAGLIHLHIHISHGMMRTGMKKKRGHVIGRNRYRRCTRIAGKMSCPLRSNGHVRMRTGLSGGSMLSSAGAGSIAIRVICVVPRHPPRHGEEEEEEEGPDEEAEAEEEEEEELLWVETKAEVRPIIIMIRMAATAAAQECTLQHLRTRVLAAAVAARHHHHRSPHRLTPPRNIISSSSSSTSTALVLACRVETAVGVRILPSLHRRHR
jgi:hypothetical protein